MRDCGDRGAWWSSAASWLTRLRAAHGRWRPSPRGVAPSSVRPVALAVVVGACALVLGQGAAWLVDGELAVQPTSWSGHVESQRHDNEPATETQVEGRVEARNDDVEFAAASLDDLVVVQVSVTSCGARSWGTGVMIADDLLITAAHVVGDAGLVRIDHGSTVLTGEVLGVFADDRDLALIEIESPLVVPVQAGEIPALDGPLTVAGFPEGGPHSVMVGPRVEPSDRAEAVVRGELLAFEAPARVGMSGGPVVDADGNLVGILVAIEVETSVAIAVTIGDPTELGEAPLVDGECPLRA